MLLCPSIPRQIWQKNPDQIIMVWESTTYQVYKREWRWFGICTLEYTTRCPFFKCGWTIIPISTPAIENPVWLSCEWIPFVDVGFHFGNLFLYQKSCNTFSGSVVYIFYVIYLFIIIIFKFQIFLNAKFLRNYLPKMSKVEEITCLSMLNFLRTWHNYVGCI